jgi:hypothetical protein
MAGEKKQKERRIGGVETPKKVRKPERHVIGSSSMWKEEELERFKVQVGALSVKEMIPEKLFDFSDLQRHRSGTSFFVTVA